MIGRPTGDFRFLCLMAVLAGALWWAISSGQQALYGHPHVGAVQDTPITKPVAHQFHPVDVVAMRTGPHPDRDPCLPEPWPVSDRERARCWIEHAFPVGEVETALRVAGAESFYLTDVCFGGRPNRPDYRRWPADPFCDPKKGSGVSGLFQHRNRNWAERSGNTLRWLGAGEVAVLDRWNGWHNTLVAAWLAGTHGWGHWDVCKESPPSSYARKFRCGSGRWLR